MVQKALFEKILNKLEPTQNIVYELCDILGISQDSAYRRLRGDTELSLSEAAKLCNHFNINIDSITNYEDKSVNFNFHNIEYGVEHFEKYLSIMLNDLSMINKAKQKEIIYACEDIPIFYNYKYPNLGAFKIYYWMEAVLNKNHTSQIKFNKDFIPNSIKEISSKIFDTYTQIPSKEIWTEMTALSVLKQIEFLWDSGKFENKEDVIVILYELTQLFEDIELQSKIGKKIHGSSALSGQRSDYELYVSEIEIGNNCVYIDLGINSSVYLGHLSFNTFSTSNKAYCNLTKEWLNNLIHKSTPISKVSEKNRYQFFKYIFKNIEELKDRVDKD